MAYPVVFLLFDFGFFKQVASGCEGEELRIKYHQAFPIDSIRFDRHGHNICDF